MLEVQRPDVSILRVLKVNVKVLNTFAQALNSRVKEATELRVFVEYINFQEEWVTARHCNWLRFKKKFPKLSVIGPKIGFWKLVGEIVKQLLVAEFEEVLSLLDLVEYGCDTRASNIGRGILRREYRCHHCKVESDYHGVLIAEEWWGPNVIREEWARTGMQISRSIHELLGNLKRNGLVSLITLAFDESTMDWEPFLKNIFDLCLNWHVLNFFDLLEIIETSSKDLSIWNVD